MFDYYWFEVFVVRLDKLVIMYKHWKLVLMIVPLISKAAGQNATGRSNKMLLC